MFNIGDQASNYSYDYYNITQDCNVTMELISLSNSSDAELSGNLSQIIDGFWLSYDQIFINSIGEFQLYFYSDCSDVLEDFISEEFNVSDQVLDQISLSLSDNEISIFSYV